MRKSPRSSHREASWSSGAKRPRLKVRRRCPRVAAAAPRPASSPRRRSRRSAREFDRAGQLDPKGFGQRKLVAPDEKPTAPGSAAALAALAAMLGRESTMPLSDELPKDARTGVDPLARQGRQVAHLTEHLQRALRVSDGVRDGFFLNQVKRDSAAAFADSARPYREKLWREVIGALDDPLVAPAPLARKIYDEPRWTGYEVVLDVLPDLHAWGILCVPKDVQAGEQRPVVVCQHGLEGVPADTVDRRAGLWTLSGFTARLAERGFVTFAPLQSLSRSGPLPRRCSARPTRWAFRSSRSSRGSTSRIVDWLGSLPFVDPSRIAFYGLSYGGKTAMRVPAVLEGYCLSICSGDFNDWIRKNVTVDCAIQLHVHRRVRDASSSTWAAPSTTRRWRT